MDKQHKINSKKYIEASGGQLGQLEKERGGLLPALDVSGCKRSSRRRTTLKAQKKEVLSDYKCSG